MSAQSSSRKPEADVAGALLRVLFAIAFATAGFLLARESTTERFRCSSQAAACSSTLLIVSPVVGALAGVLDAHNAQLFFESALSATERSIERRAPR